MEEDIRFSNHASEAGRDDPLPCKLAAAAWRARDGTGFCNERLDQQELYGSAVGNRRGPSRIRCRPDRGSCHPQPVRAWQPLLLTIFQLRLALLRRGRAGDPEAYGRTAIEAVEFSTKVLNGIRSLIIPSPMVIQPTSEIATEAPFIQGDEPTLRIASSLVAVSVYLLEDALTEGS
jgi:hypothetical protein